MSWTTGTVGRCTSMQTALFYLFSSNQSTASKFDIWEHLLTHQLVLFYMHRPSEGLQSAQGSKVMNNRQDSILNRPRIMGLRADHWPQHWKIVLKVLSKVDFFFFHLIFSFRHSQQEGQFTMTHVPPPSVKSPTRWVVRTSCHMCEYSLGSLVPMGYKSQ